MEVPPLKLLLHACCCPCTLEPLRLLLEEGHDIAIAYMNSNIHPAEEYEHRRAVLLDFAREQGLKVIEGVYDPQVWSRAAGVFGTDPDQRPDRCRACYRLRLEEACAYAEKRMRGKNYVSLGGFGGYIVVGFDHSVMKRSTPGGPDVSRTYDFAIVGNSFKGSSEPGIVWVMQDENGNGLPDDTWYELKGSEYGGAETRLDYAVTYYRPDSPGQPVAWTDNEGGSGQVDYLPAFHTQDYCYPAWITGDTYTLIGRKLKPRTEMITENYWVNHEYEWGYSDNFSPIDRLADDDNHNASVNCNYFKISNAVTYDGRPADLKYIDFVKIQTGVQAKAGWLGENSTEVFGISDYNLLK